MFVQTEITPNPNSLKFLPGKSVSLIGPVEITEINKTNNELIRNILSINGVKGVFLSNDFISVNKHNEFEWEDLKHTIISFINDYFSNGNESVIFKEFKDGIVRVELQGACSGCPSAALTLKQGVQNLLCHYIPEVREVEAV